MRHVKSHVLVTDDRDSESQTGRYDPRGCPDVEHEITSMTAYS
jgi:hypothetical protein